MESILSVLGFLFPATSGTIGLTLALWGGFSADASFDEVEMLVPVAQEVRMGVDFDFNQVEVEAAADWDAQSHGLLPDLLEGLAEGLFSGLFGIDPAAEILGLFLDRDDADPFVDEILGEYQPLLFTELNFVRIVASDLTVAERKNVLVAAQRGVKEAYLAASRHHAGLLQTTDGLDNDSSYSTSALRAGLISSLKAALPEDKFSRYVFLSEFHQSQQKHAAILDIVSRLDSELILTQAQRECLIGELTSHWKPSWAWRWNFLWIDEIAPIPDSIMQKCLTEAQLDAWESLAHNFFEVSGNMLEFPERDEWWTETDAADQSGSSDQSDVELDSKGAGSNTP
ncbi:hypothetical protein [Schlesneria sp.]|uniref:hypothetical protein n=1 Tax=Schlesneria sp. TaxID=2762018 RepID=UPI002EEFC5DB